MQRLAVLMLAWLVFVPGGNAWGRTAARDKEACEQHASALEACKNERTRAGHRECVAGQLQTASLKKN